MREGGACQSTNEITPPLCFTSPFTDKPILDKCRKSTLAWIILFMYNFCFLKCPLSSCHLMSVNSLCCVMTHDDPSPRTYSMFSFLVRNYTFYCQILRGKVNAGEVFWHTTQQVPPLPTIIITRLASLTILWWYQNIGMIHTNYLLKKKTPA